MVSGVLCFSTDVFRGDLTGEGEVDASRVGEVSFNLFLGGVDGVGREGVVGAESWLPVGEGNGVLSSSLVCCAVLFKMGRGGSVTACSCCL